MTIYRFTADANTIAVEDLAVLLRDGRDPVAVGALEHDGNPVVFVDYEKDAVEAQTWYDLYPFLGMSRIS